MVILIAHRFRMLHIFGRIYGAAGYENLDIRDYMRAPVRIIIDRTTFTVKFYNHGVEVYWATLLYGEAVTFEEIIGPETVVTIGDGTYRVTPIRRITKRPRRKTPDKATTQGLYITERIAPTIGTPLSHDGLSPEHAVITRLEIDRTSEEMFGPGTSPGQHYTPPPAYRRYASKDPAP